MRLRITLLWAAAAALHLGIVLAAPRTPPAPGPSPALAEHLRRRADEERPETAAAALQLALLAGLCAVAARAGRRERARPGSVASVMIGSALGFGVAFFVGLQVLMFVAVGFPDFAFGTMDEALIAQWLSIAFVAGWLLAIGGAPLGAALLHGGRPLDLRALIGAQALAGGAGAASLGVATWSGQLALPPRPALLFPVAVLFAASVAGYLRVLAGRAEAGATAGPPPAAAAPG